MRRQNRVGELGIRSQRADLEDESEGDVLEVNVPERLDLRTVAGQGGNAT